MSAAAPLRLLAQDAEDLSVISAALQDAVTRVEDILFDQRGRSLTLAFNRYCWEHKERGQRVRSGLQVGCVFEVRSRGIHRGQGAAVLELLALAFVPDDAPGGQIHFAFAGDADLTARVECIDAALVDVGEPWAAPHRPKHLA